MSRFIAFKEHDSGAKLYVDPKAVACISERLIGPDENYKDEYAVMITLHSGRWFVLDESINSVISKIEGQNDE